jgi:hypothetical protein
MVTRLAWMAHRLVSSKSETRYASEASWRAMTALEEGRIKDKDGAEGQRRKIEGSVECGDELSDSRRLESKVGLEVLSDLSNESLEGELSDEELGGLGRRDAKSRSGNILLQTNMMYYRKESSPSGTS